MQRRNFLKTIAALFGVAAVPELPKAPADEVPLVENCQFRGMITQELLDDDIVGRALVSGALTTPRAYLLQDGKCIPYDSASAALNDARAGDTVEMTGGLLDYRS